MLTPAQLEAFVAHYNLCSAEPAYLNSIRDSHRFTCRTLDGQQFEILHDHLVFPREDWHKDPRIFATFPDERQRERDYFGISAVVYMRIQDLAVEAQKVDVDPANAILLLTVHRWSYHGSFWPAGYVFMNFETPFREVWVWSENQENRLQCDFGFIHSLKPFRHDRPWR